FGGIVFLAPIVIPWFLGDQWGLAVPLIQVMAITGILRLVATPVSGAYAVLQRARANILTDLLRVALIGSAIFLIVQVDLDQMTAVWMLYGAMAAVYVTTWIYVLFLLRARGKDSV